MAGLDADLEKAFTNGDPEAVLDFLVLRSRQALHEDDDDDSVCSVPHFTSDNDMAAFVRDLTIDDAISHCFADLPSSCDDDIVTSSSQALLPSRPEKKLTDPKRAREAETLQKHASYHGKPSATVKHQSPSHSASSSVSGGTSRGKSRGFLSSFLGRGHKGRRGDQQRKPAPHPPHDLSSKQPRPPFSHCVAESEMKPVSADRELVAHARLNGDHVGACLLESNPSYGDLADVSEKQATVEKQQRTGQDRQGVDSVHVTERKARQMTGEDDPVCVIEYCFSPSAGQEVDSVEHKLEHHSNPSAMTGKCNIQHRQAACGDLGSSSTYAQAVANRPQGSDRLISQHTHLPNSVSSTSRQTDKDQPLGGPGNLMHKSHHPETQTRTQLTGPALEKTQTTAVVHSAQHTPLPCAEKDQKPTPQTPWEGICDGVDAFIDFERDPNVEVPLDGGPLSARFDFSRTASEAGVQEREHFRNIPVDNHPDTESPQLALQTCAVTPGDHLFKASPEYSPGTKPPAPKSTPMSMSQHLLLSQSSLKTLSKVSAGTQTENSSLEPEQVACVYPRVDHCLRTAVAQLSALSACCSCQDVISRTLADMKKTLWDIENEISRGNMGNPEPVPHRHPRNPYKEKQTVNNTLADEEASEKLHHVESSPSSVHSAETGLPGQNKPPHGEGERVGRGEDGHPKAGVTSLTKPPHSRSCHDQSTHRSRQPGLGKKRTSSRKSVDSDSASTSTVTSEPVTVCQRATPSSSGSSKSGLPLRKLPASTVKFSSGHVDSGSAGNSESPDPPQSYVTDADPSQPSSAENKTQIVAMPCQTTMTATSAAILFRSPSRARKDARNTARYAGEADRDYESFMTSSWSEMTSVSSVSDIVTSADESSYYSGDDDDNEDEDEEEEEEEDDLTAVVRLGLLDEDRDDSELRQHRLQRHLAAVLRQNSIPASTVETVVAATGERLNGQDRPGQHVNQGSLYPFSGRVCAQGTPAGHESEQSPATAAVLPSGSRVKGGSSSVGPHPAAATSAAAVPGRETRPAKKTKKGTGPRLFSPERQVSLIAARQMTSEEFREGYDRSTDVAKAKRSQLDGDIPWDLIPCSDTDDDLGSEKAWYHVTSEEDSVTHVYGSDTDSSTTVSDW